MIFLKKIIFFIFLDRSDEVMLKIIFIKIKNIILIYF